MSASARQSRIWRRSPPAILPALLPGCRPRDLKSANVRTPAAQSHSQACARSRAAGAVLCRQCPLWHFRRHRGLHGRGACRIGGVICDDTAVADHAGRHRDHRRGVRWAHPDPARRNFHQGQTDHHLWIVRRRPPRRSCLQQAFACVVFDSLFHLSEEGWRKLTSRWAIFFFALAVLNEIVWRSVSTDTWVTFKVFGVVPLTIVFGALQVPLLKRYAVEPAE